MTWSFANILIFEKMSCSKLHSSKKVIPLKLPPLKKGIALSFPSKKVIPLKLPPLKKVIALKLPPLKKGD
ncbi:MAG: hypothetical protein SFW66_11010 [Gammaproteobacteria bacterium]|nr:hypothetical protein [Gammaproteobacteria bacterium]